MYYNRLIPCLLLSNQGLVKTINFKKPRYIGDPINAVRIFNDKEVDELIFLDIDATRQRRGPNFEYLKKITEQCFMPLCYGGGVTGIGQMKELFKIGFEKVAINHAAYTDTSLLEKAVRIFGGQSIVGSMDVKKSIFKKQTVWVNNGTVNTSIDPVQYAVRLEEAGIGEIFLNSVDKDGTMSGYDYELIEKVSNAVNIPVIACGGAQKAEDCSEAIGRGASAAAAGSMFVFWGRNHAVLINYPDSAEVGRLFC